VKGIREWWRYLSLAEKVGVVVFGPVMGPIMLFYALLTGCIDAMLTFQWRAK